MVLSARPVRRRAPERVVAWVVTGPLGHLWSAVADIGMYSLRRLADNVRGRIP